MWFVNEIADRFLYIDIYNTKSHFILDTHTPFAHNKIV